MVRNAIYFPETNLKAERIKPVATARRRTGIATTLFLFAAITSSITLGESGIYSFIILGDIVLVCVLGALFVSKTKSERLSLKNLRMGVAALAAVFVVTTLFEIIDSKPWYSGTETISSVVRYLLFFYAIDQFTAVLKRTDGIPRISLAFVATTCVLANFLQYLSFAGAIPVLPFIEDPSVDWDPFAGLPRLYGLFSEPSTAAIFFTMMILFSVESKRRSPVLIVTFAALLVATFALTAGILILGVGFGYLLSGLSGIRQVVRWIPILLLVLGFFALIPQTRGAFESRILDRTLSGADDNSTSIRLVDSWTASYRVNPPPFVGVGIGQYPGAIDQAGRDGLLSDVSPALVKQRSGWNVFAFALAEGGPTGIAALVGAIFTIRNKRMRWFMVALGFTTGTLVGWLFWCCFALATSVPAIPNAPSRTRRSPTAVQSRTR